MRIKFYLLGVLVCFSMLPASAQNWGGGVDNAKYHWGFMFQYVSTQNIIRTAEGFRNVAYPVGGNDMSLLQGVEAIASPGFAIGGVLNYNLNKHLDLRFTPSFTLTQRVINYYWNVPAPNNAETAFLTKKETGASLVELPLSLKLKSERVGNYRFYLLGGMKYSMNVTSSDKYDNQMMSATEKFVNYKRQFLSYEAGVGTDFYLNYFKMSAELKYSRSLGSILQKESHVYSESSLDKVFLRHISFSLFFENLL